MGCVVSTFDFGFSTFVRFQIAGFPSDLVLVGRATVLIRGISARLDIPWSLAREWAPIAQAVLDREEGRSRVVRGRRGESGLDSSEFDYTYMLIKAFIVFFFLLFSPPAGRAIVDHASAIAEQPCFRCACGSARPHRVGRQGVGGMGAVQGKRCRCECIIMMMMCVCVLVWPEWFRFLVLVFAQVIPKPWRQRILTFALWVADRKR